MSDLISSSSSNESQLVPVFPGQIGGNSVNVCDGRTLHTFLENGELFSTWIKDRIEKYGFQENHDFVSFLEKTKKPQGGRPGRDYHLCLDMAKELSMVENNDKGRQARRYFIDCERRALAAKTPISINPEPPRLTFATKAQREPLVNAVRRLVKVAESKGRALNYSDAHSIVNLKLGVEDIEHLTPEQIPQAMKLVGEILQTVVLQGEYIAKGEPDPAPEPDPKHAPISNEESGALKQLVWSLANGSHYNAAWTNAIWHALRLAADCPSPHRFEVRHLPILAAELKRIMIIMVAYREHRVILERALLKRAIRDRQPEPVYAEMRAKEQEWLNETAPILAKIDAWQQASLDAMTRMAA